MWRPERRPYRYPSRRGYRPGLPLGRCVTGWIKPLAVVAGLALAICAVAMLYWKFDIKRRSAAHVIQFTRQDLRNVLSGLALVEEIDKKQLWTVSDTNRTIPGSEIYRKMMGTPDALEVARPTELSVKGRAFRDAWGNEIHARIEPTADKFRIRMWSNGPNQKDESGTGDDVVEVGSIRVQQ